jgi:xanthine dehydrogenase molybdopterin-binding subunit B
MPDYRLIGKNYITPELIAKVTGRAKYAEDFRAEGMLFAKLLLSPMPHAPVRGIDTTAALAMPGVEAILTADDLPEMQPPSESRLTNEPPYEGEQILAVAAIDELTAVEAIERIVLDHEPLPCGCVEWRLLLSIADHAGHDYHTAGATTSATLSSNGARLRWALNLSDCRAFAPYYVGERIPPLKNKTKKQRNHAGI